MQHRWLALFTLGLSVTFAHAADPIQIGSRRELFVDRFLIDQLNGVELRLREPKSAGVAIKLDKPWEGIVSGYFTVIKDGPKYLMYYRGRPSTSRRDGTVETKEVACYAESADGMRWTRPNVGLFEVAGTRDNNVIMIEPKTVTHNFAPFIDKKPGVPASERVKAVGGTGSEGLFGFSSPDGIHWKPVREKPLITEGDFDSQNVAFWSESENSYLCYFRKGKSGIRWVRRTTSTNFLDWTPPVEMSFGDAPPEHIYINQTHPYFRAPHIYISTAARFNPGRRGLTEEQIKAIDLDNPRNYGELKNDTSDAVLITSRGGNVYNRTFLESFIRPGLDWRNWVSRANYPALGVIQTGPAEMSLYIERHYGQPSVCIERMTLRTDGFVSVSAPYKPGEMITKPLQFSGKELEINFSTSAAGYLRVELQTADGAPIPGFSLDACPEIIGDQIARIVRWKNGSDVNALAGNTVRLRFLMKDADLYSLRFHDGSDSDAKSVAPSEPSTTGLKKMISVHWKKGPSLPRGFQDSDGGIIGSRLITVAGFCSGQNNVSGKADKYPRGFIKNVWSIDQHHPSQGWQSMPDFPGVHRQEFFGIVVEAIESMPWHPALCAGQGRSGPHNLCYWRRHRQ